jgi:murein DD-endopeptidase MepM/ murein hydrolase activator NlpD
VLIVTGESVTPGQVIGEVGATGLATGAHLHFEVQVDGVAVDPVDWLA